MRSPIISLRSSQHESGRKNVEKFFGERRFAGKSSRRSTPVKTTFRWLAFVVRRGGALGRLMPSLGKRCRLLENVALE
ncbi:hypothetical protein RSSM_05618 [Rhodopirellula sallentina SM41]|uniref:Uncharacterized protein n=1 Tax=Rhodopirellula sallentina SM41 TaxID=1263870 RepID=M5TV76_9BACT|nr:hypothetical protein RSSM_05618 [Rhodopirellula sallentina SM41]